MGCKVWEPKDCICGFRARMASLIMGWLGAVGGFIYMTMSLALWEEFLESYRIFVCKYRSDNLYSDNCVNQSISFVALTSITAFMTCVASILLIVGVKKENSTMVLIYLGLKCFTLALYGGLAVSIVLYWVINYFWYHLFIIVSLGSLGIYLEVFFFLHVRVYYRKLVYPDLYCNKESEDTISYEMNSVEPVI